MHGYFLRGVEGDYVFVVKSGDPEDICRLIARLCKTRDKELRELGEQLEKDWNDRHREDSKQTRPKDKSKLPKRK